MIRQTAKRALIGAFLSSFLGAFLIAPIQASAEDKTQSAPKAQSAPRVPNEKARAVAIQAVNRYINALTHLQGVFTQTNPDGSVAKGKFYMRRPWRMRFEYAPPNKMLVIADGTWLIVQEEGAGKHADRYPLGATPARFLLAPQTDFNKAARILDMLETRQRLILLVASRDNELPGYVEIAFDKGPVFQLAEWTVIDAQGLRTRVVLSNLKRGIRAAARLFRPQEKNPFKGNKRRR